MKHFIIGAVLVVPLFLIGGCAEQGSDLDGLDDAAYIETFPASGLRKSPDSLQPLEPTNPSLAHHDFAFSDYRAHTPANENTLSAPFDLQQLLTSIALGADGTTLEAFSTASGFNLNDVSTHAGISIWEQQVSDLVSIERHGFLWGQPGYRFAPAYLQSQAELFGPTMSGLDFLLDPFQSQTSINDTLGGELAISGIGNRTRLVAAQTTRLETGWSATSTIESINGRFGIHEEQRWVDMVRITGAYHTAAGENYQAVEIPLTDPDLSMVIIIPTPGQFDNIRQNLDAILWNDIRGKLEASEPAAETTVHIPTFALARELSNDDMPYLGVALIDNAEGSPSSAPDNPDTTANFSRVNNAGFLYLETPQQHIALTVDEQGLNASTVTAAVHMATKDEPSNLFNSAYISSFSFGLTSHNGTGFFLTISGDTQPCFYPPEQNPFLFAIYAAASDTLLYLGQVQALEGPLVTADWTVPNDTWFCGLTPPVEIYKYNGSLQCEPDDGITIWDMKQELSNAGIEVLDYYQGTDGNAYITLCGSPDGIINIFTIPEPQVPLAKELGFSERTELAL